MYEFIVRITDFISYRITPLLNTLAAGVVIVFLGFIIGKVAGKMLHRVLKDAQLNQNAKRVLQRDLALEKWISGTVSYSIYAAAIILALMVWGITSIVLNTILVVIVLLLGLSGVFALRDLVPNIVAGVHIKRHKTICVGNKIIFDGVSGKVIEQSFTETIIERKNGDKFIVPNALLRKKVVHKK